MKFVARMMDAETGGEGRYEFDAPEGLFKKTADEIVAVFFDHVESTILKNGADWELNSAMKNRDRNVVTAMGAIILSPTEPSLPFLLMISHR